MSLKDKLVAGTTVSVLGAVAAVGAAGYRAAFGAIGGQILDWIPYFNHAIPEGIAYLGNAFSDADRTREVAQSLYGNLDKLGAFLGFMSGFIKADLSCKKD